MSDIQATRPKAWGFSGPLNGDEGEPAGTVSSKMSRSALTAGMSASSVEAVTERMKRITGRLTIGVVDHELRSHFSLPVVGLAKRASVAPYGSVSRVKSSLTTRCKSAPRGIAGLRCPLVCLRPAGDHRRITIEPPIGDRTDSLRRLPAIGLGRAPVDRFG